MEVDKFADFNEKSTLVLGGRGCCLIADYTDYTDSFDLAPAFFFTPLLRFAKQDVGALRKKSCGGLGQKGTKGFYRGEYSIAD